MKERLVSLAILVFSFVYLAGAIKLKVGTLSQPGAGFVPAGFAVALLMAAGFNVYNNFKAPKGEKGDGWRSQLVPVGIGLSLVAYPFILEPLSYVIATFIVMFFLLWLMHFKTVLVSLFTAVTSSLVSYFLFAKLLRVILPSGLIEEFILRL